MGAIPEGARTRAGVGDGPGPSVASGWARADGRIIEAVELADRVKQDLTAAMKAGEKSRVSALRLVLSELQKAAKEGDGDEVAVLRRERKRRHESATAFRGGGRPELAEAEEAEAQVIEAYLRPSSPTTSCARSWPRRWPRRAPPRPGTWDR